MLATPNAELDHLLVAVAEEDRAAFRRLYELSAPKLFATILRIVKVRASAEEILQDVYLRIWQNAGSFSPELASARAWMNSIARNRAIDVLRQKTATPASSLDDDGTDWFERIAEDRDREADMIDNASLRRCLGTIDAQARDCVLLAYYEGFSREELAQRYARPVNTIKTWLHRSLATLRACLDGGRAMSDVQGLREPGDVDLVAAEYVLGTLDAAERGAFAQRLRSDGAAKLAVSGWERRFAGLADRVASVEPPPHVWASIEQALQSPPVRERTFKVVDGGGLMADGTPWLERSRNRWRASSLALGAIAAALVAFVAVDRTSRVAPEPAGSYVAAINRGGDKAALLVRVDLATRKVSVVPVAAQTPPDRSLELWYIGDDKTPRAVGLLDKGPSTMAMPDGTQVGATFAVSVEPPGGSTTGGPTGPVVYSGQLVKE